jgi:hypothetical protein
LLRWKDATALTTPITLVARLKVRSQVQAVTSRSKGTIRLTKIDVGSLEVGGSNLGFFRDRQTFNDGCGWLVSV